MNREQFRRSIDELHERLVNLTVTKGEEYKRAEDNQFANFERGAATLGMTREQVLWVYLSKHMDSIATYIKDHAQGVDRVYAEPITGRVDDAILYLLLFRGMTQDAGSGAGQAPGSYSGSGPVRQAVREARPVAPVGMPVPAARSRGAGDAAKGPSVTMCGPGHFVSFPGKLTEEDRTAIAGAFKGAVFIDHLPPGNYPGPTMGDLQEQVHAWANDTFGERAPARAWLKTFSEIGEVIDNPDDPLEWADVFIMLLDLAKMYNINVTRAILDKLFINKGRKWTERNGVFTHVKDDDNG